MKENKYTSWHAYNTGQANRNKVYNYICEFIKIHGFAPTLKEVGSGIGISFAAVRKHLLALIEEGRLETDYSRPSARNIQIPKGAI